VGADAAVSSARLAWDHALCRAVLGVYTRVLLDLYAGGAGARGVRRDRTRSVTVLQRAGNRRSYCDLLHEQSLDRLLRAVHGQAVHRHFARKNEQRLQDLLESMASGLHRPRQ